MKKKSESTAYSCFLFLLFLLENSLLCRKISFLCFKQPNANKILNKQGWTYFHCIMKANANNKDETLGLCWTFFFTILRFRYSMDNLGVVDWTTNNMKNMIMSSSSSTPSPIAKQVSSSLSISSVVSFYNLPRYT